MADIDSIWREMNVKSPSSVPNPKAKKKEKEKVKEATKGKEATEKQKAAAAAAAAILKPSTVPAPAKSSKKKKEEEEEGQEGSAVAAAVLIDYDGMKAKVSRDVQAIADENGVVRRKALQRLHKTLFDEHTMSDEDYGETFRDLCKGLFKRFADPVEKCRELSLKVTQQFFERGADLVPVLGYYFPALMLRLPSGLAYDEDMKVFISDLEGHEEFRRGKAVERQDKGTFSS